MAGGDVARPGRHPARVAAATRSLVTEPARLAGLTARERDVLAQVGAERSNTEIGQALFLSPDTARTYVSRLLQKANARDRAQLVVIAYESGLVRPGQDRAPRPWRPHSASSINLHPPVTLSVRKAGETRVRRWTFTAVAPVLSSASPC